MSEDKAENNEELEKETKAEKKQSPLNIVSYILIAVVVILLCVIGFIFTSTGQEMLGLSAKAELKEDKGKTPETEFDPGEIDPKNTDFIPIPDLLVNLSSRKIPESSRSSFLKLKLVMQISEAKEKDEIKKMIPLIVDQFQIFLRELDFNDISGAEGLHRLKQELINRANHAIAPKKIINVLIKEILIQ